MKPVFVLCVFAAPLLVCCSKNISKEPTGPQTVQSETKAAKIESAGSVDAVNVEPMLTELTQALRKYGAEKQRAPKNLNELVAAGYLPAVPAAPTGKVFAIDKMMRVYLAEE
jgi:hypothetical protein